MSEDIEHLGHGDEVPAIDNDIEYRQIELEARTSFKR